MRIFRTPGKKSTIRIKDRTFVTPYSQDLCRSIIDEYLRLELLFIE
jgi:hypothetical protein